MSDALLLAVSPGEVWAVLVEDGRAVELRIVRAGGVRVGQVFAGRVDGINREMGAVFVDLGRGRPALLNAGKSLATLTEGQAIIVEVTREARGQKGPEVRLVQKGEPTPDTEPVLDALALFLATPPERIVVDERAAYALLRGFLERRHPHIAAALELYTGAEPLFEYEGVAGDVAGALAPSVALPRGGRIIIERTEAATLIDVDSGGGAAVAANLAAAETAARAIRLRDIAGPIVIDFIGMKDRAARARVADALKEGLARDPQKSDFLGWTRLGHFELVRRRARAALDEILYERDAGGGRVKTALTVALAALRDAARAARAEPGRGFALHAAPEVVAALADGPARAARAALEAREGRALALASDASLGREAFDIRPL